ncbi:MAG: tyrosine-type recombinase/integrase, partial [Betaproteobacteria bacterium]|nr:tyrosine-type recombinase/integrase [Betaproteobacteria bacterium]
WLMRLLEDTCPPEDRLPNRLVFPGASQSAVGNAMARACRAAGIPVYSPHDLRHRRASLWHGQGLSGRELAERGGWAKVSMPLDVYSHLIPDKEVGASQYAEVLR